MPSELKMALECSDVEKCIREIRLERHWKEDGVGKEGEFLNHIKQKFFDWADQMVKLCNENKYEEHEKIVKEIVELRTYLDNIFPKNGYTFVIDVFQVGPHRVVTEHYFSPQPFYSNNSVTSLRKHVTFTVYFANQVVRRYFLESSEYYGLNYVLGSSSADYRLHRQHRQYLTVRPTYEQMKGAVVEDLTVGGRCLISSYVDRGVPFDNVN